LGTGALAESGWFATDVLDRLVRQHVSGRSDHSATLWKLMMLDGFLRRMQQGSVAVNSESTAREVLVAGGVQ
jgi:asparagine synthase (glutamine-hydrolysing)